MLTIKEVAEKYGVLERTVRNWINKGLKSRKEYIGLKYKILIDVRDIDEFLQNNKGE